MSLVDDLRSQIEADRVTFDGPVSRSRRLKRELFGKNEGAKVTEALQGLVLEVAGRESASKEKARAGASRLWADYLSTRK